MNIMSLKSKAAASFLAVLFALSACRAGSDSATAQANAGAATAELQLQALEWRNVGPFNGGRGTTVVGHPTEKMVFYFGHSSGGLWKTEDAGMTWEQVGAGQFNYASVGAMAIYEKDPNIMYVGLGEPQLRQSVSWGDGMYKSVDGGVTWTSAWTTHCTSPVSEYIPTTRTSFTSRRWATRSVPMTRRAYSAHKTVVRPGSASCSRTKERVLST
jgi:hypothetical protein